MSEYSVDEDACGNLYLVKPDGEKIYGGTALEEAIKELNRLEKLCREFIYNETSGEPYPPPIRE